jgi:phage terminase large subunit GpA-like protein
MNPGTTTAPRARGKKQRRDRGDEEPVKRTSEFASAEEVAAGAMSAWRPPPKLSLSQWAEEKFYLSAESSAEAGRWKCMPFQVGIMDAISDPTIPFVTLMKSARVGFTKCINAAIGYHMDQDPCSMLVVQPTVEDAKGWSKEELAPMLRDVPALAELAVKDLDEGGPKTSKNTIQAKRFPGGVISIIGANSGTGFRRISRRVVILDEVDAYPASAGSDGDPVKLATRRSDFFWNRKRVAGSTPLVKGSSRIEALYEEGDQRRFHVPCPQCGHMDILVWSKRDSGGHYLTFDEADPDGAFFACSKNGCPIEHKDKRWMMERGEWRAAKPFAGHASFHIWAAYSYSPNATWGQLVREFLEARKSPETFRTFVNTVLGETWQERGEAPDHERLFSRRETYQVGTVPEGVLVLTAGVDVQKDRWVYEVVGWGPDKQSWSIEAGEIRGDTAREEDWAKLDELLEREFPAADGTGVRIRTLAVDSGFQTQLAYLWTRRIGWPRAIAVKGVSGANSLLGVATKVDVKAKNGKRLPRGARVWPVGVDIAKQELYGWLRLDRGETTGPFPRGWCHFPEHPEEYFKQLTAEQLVEFRNRRTGRSKREWHVIPGRENHWLDARIYARAAAAAAGLDRIRPTPPPPIGTRAPEPPAAPAQAKALETAAPAPTPKEPPPKPAPKPPPQRAGRLQADSRFGFGRGKGGWLKPR